MHKTIQRNVLVAVDGLLIMIIYLLIIKSYTSHPDHSIIVLRS